MRVLFTVQGQGRGHMTQSIAASEILRSGGHELVAVVAGNHPGRTLPDFFVDAFDAPVTMLPSPGFVFRQERGVDMVGTLWHGSRHLPEWISSLRRMRALIDDARPDLIVNFFEPLVGILQALGPLPAPVLSAAHQFVLLDNHGARAAGRDTAPLWLRGFIRMVGFRSHHLALSFTPADPSAPPDPLRSVGPPLLRRRVLELEPERGDYVLVYMATHGYSDNVRAWHRDHLETRLHCFCDRPDAPDVESVGPNLTFHQLDGDKFLRLMAGCRAVLCTAGFESICEAAYLGKPVLMIPLEGHHEQRLNASDGEASGVAVGHPDFDLDALSRLPAEVDTGWFRSWCLEAERTFLDTAERVASS